MRPTRRQVLSTVGAAALLATVPGMPALGAGTRRRVAVLGGGMAGLAAAHELVDRGFDVTVLERKALGGKARSIPVPGTGTGGRADLPGEHGFRFFPGFYRHVPDTMREIPVAGNANGVHDNFIDLISARISRDNGRADIVIPKASAPHAESVDLGLLRETVTGLIQQVAALPASELALFVNRVLVYLTSSDDRKFGQWEQTAWWDFIKADGKSNDYQTIVARFLTSGLVAVKERVASTRTVGAMGQAFILAGLGLGTDPGAGLARMLNGPTNEAWIDPWVSYLTGRGVRFLVGQTVTGFSTGGGSVTGVTVADTLGTSRTIEADWFISAVPVDRMPALLSRDLLTLDPSLASLVKLNTEWMNGLQIYLKQTPQLEQEISFMDSAWQITAVLDSRLWNRDYPASYGDGTAVDCLSLDVSDWETPGIVYGKPAQQCTRQQVFDECWAQMKAHLEDTGRSVLPDGIVHSWFLDPAIAWQPALGANTNDEPLMVNTVGSWANRPATTTAIPNLFLAGDYVRTSTDLATMEGANESGKRAVNALLAAADSTATPVTTYTLYQPPALGGVKKLDAARYKAGLPNLFDT